MNDGFKKGGCVSQLTKLERILLVLLFLLSVALVALIIALVLKTNDDKKGLEVCTTTDCVTAANSILEKIDESVDPCDDFYKFSCGRWMDRRVIPDDQSSVNIFLELINDVDIILKNLMEAPIASSDADYVKKVKTLYRSCLNYDLINKKGIEPLTDLIKQRYGGWPLTTPGWDKAKFDLTNMLVKLNQLDCFPMVVLYVGTDRKDSTKRVLVLDQTSFGMPGQKYYQVPRNNTMLMAYQQYIYEVGKVFGYLNDTAALQEVQDIVDFEIRLASITVPSEERRDSNKLHNPMPLKEIATNYGQILDWDRYVQGLMTSDGVGVMDVTENEIIINQSPEYFVRLIDVLGETPKRTLANYLIWMQIKTLIFTQGDIFNDLYSEYRKVVFGVKSKPPRFRTCIRYVSGTNYLGLAVGRIFIKDNFDNESMEAALSMIKDLRVAFGEILEENDWMDAATKKVATEKNRYIAPKIGYPKYVLNDTYMAETFADYSYTDDNYLENVLTNVKESFRDNMKRLREAADKRFPFTPSAVNAYYSVTHNQIMFPAGVLQPPFFSKHFPKSLNYGGIGVAIGHEITHGFDDRGRQYDKVGNLVQWWTKEAEYGFRNKSKCIVEQYGNYTVEEINMNVNGINTQGENIADNGGLKQAFKAYRSWVSQQGKEEDPLPGLKYSHDQLFFINFAQIWCNLMRDEDAMNRIRTGVHSPGRFRVIGTAQNSEDFSRVFKCPATSEMNPEKKCSVW